MNRGNESRTDEEMMWGAAGAAMIAFSVILAFFALVGTAICIQAYNKRLEFFGYVLEPVDARTYLQGGGVGAVLGVYFCGFLALLFKFNFLAAFVLFMLGGYTIRFFGSMLAVQAQKEARVRAAQDIPLIAPKLSPSAPAIVRRDESHEAPRFQYATWNDEDE